MNNENNIFIASTINRLLDSKALNGDNNNRTKVLSEKIGQELETIPEFNKFMNEDNTNIKHKFFVEFGRYIKFNKYQKGETIQYIGESDKLFYMILTGRILKLNIKYKNLYVSLKDYIIYLSKLFILGEKNLYNDCIKKNIEVVPIKENIDIIKYGNKIKFCDFQAEIKKIKKMKEEILFNININDEKIKKKLNIDDILILYNPDKEIKGKNNFLSNEMKFSVSLPYFYVDKIMEPISFLGHLNKNRGIKTYSSFICLNHCDVFYLDKDNIKNGDDVIYSYVYRKKSEIITNNLFKNHFLFKDIDISFLLRNYSKYFEIINAKKDDFIIYQGSMYEGVFFIIDGMMQLKSNRSYNELNDLNFYIINNLDKQDNINNFNIKKKSGIINKLIHNPLFIKKSNQKKGINFGTYTNNDIFGLNDIYDKRNGIYNFSVQCMTNEALLFFIPKEIFTSLITNKEINDKIRELTEEKNKVLSLKIQKYRDLFELEFDKFLSPDKDEKNNINKNEFYKKIYNNSLEKKTVINPLIIKNEKKILFENNNKLKSKSVSDINKLYYNNYYSNDHNNDIIVNQNNNYLKNSLGLNHDSPKNNIKILQSQNLQRLNNLSINKESQILSLNNIHRIIYSKNNNNNNISKTLNNIINNNNNHSNKNYRKINRFFKSSSTDSLSQFSENEKMKKRMDELFYFYERKQKDNINNNQIIPLIKEIKNKRNINYKIKKEKTYFNLLNKKNNNFIDISPNNNCITINKENYKNCIVNIDSNNDLFSKNDKNNIKKIVFKKLI